MMELLSLPISVYLRVFMRCVACACIRGVCRAMRARVCGVYAACVWRVCGVCVTCTCVCVCMHAICMYAYVYACMYASFSSG